MSFFGSVIVGILKGAWGWMFPDKSAAEQRADDLAQTTKDARDAIKEEQKADNSSDATLNSELSKWVRNNDK